jgi:hypothetical protein
MEIENDDDKPALPYGACAAYGCPMSGAIAQSQTGSDRWLCNIHFHAHGSNWNEITQRLNQHRVEVRLINAIRGSMTGRLMDMSQTLDYLNCIGQPFLLPTVDDRRADGKLSMRRWLYRLEKKLAEDVQKGLDIEVGTVYKASPEGLMEIADQFLKRHLVGA